MRIDSGFGKKAGSEPVTILGARLMRWSPERRVLALKVEIGNRSDRTYFLCPHVTGLDLAGLPNSLAVWLGGPNPGRRNRVPPVVEQMAAGSKTVVLVECRLPRSSAAADETDPFRFAGVGIDYLSVREIVVELAWWASARDARRFLAGTEREREDLHRVRTTLLVNESGSRGS